jgi:hypothetical protein
VLKKYDKEVSCKIAIGGLIFLRFILPAIVTPYELKIIKFKLSDSTKRNMMLISKILNQAALGLEFVENGKEKYLFHSNSLLKVYIPKVEKMLSELPIEDKDSKIGFKEIDESKHSFENALKTTDDEIDTMWALHNIHLYFFDKINNIYNSIKNDEKSFSTNVNKKEMTLYCEDLIDVLKEIGEPSNLNYERDILIKK